MASVSSAIVSAAAGATRPGLAIGEHVTVGLLESELDVQIPQATQILFVDSAAVIGLNVPDTYLIGVSALQPHRRGSVRLVGSDLELVPIIDPNYLGDDRDMATMVKGFEIARAIGTAAALNAWRAEENDVRTFLLDVGESLLSAVIRQRWRNLA
jgi:choline dehydrogenase-like flavoprotein